MGTAVLSCGKAAGHPVRLVPRLRISGAIPLIPYIPSWRGRGKLLLYIRHFYCIVYYEFLRPILVRSFKYFMCWKYIAYYQLGDESVMSLTISV